MLKCKIKIFAALLGSLISLVTGDYGFNNFGTFSFDGVGDNRMPWFDSSKLIPHYSGVPYPYDTLKHGTDPIPSIKKIPNEDKAFKKNILPFYHTLSDNDDPKYKERILKSGDPYCQEIVAKDTSTDAKKSPVKQRQMTCYRCKDPKNGSVYEQCSYTSQQPEGSRGTRSNIAAEKTLDSLTSASHSRDSKKSGSEKLPENYRFGDEYFQPQSTPDSAELEKESTDNCKRVVRDSMVCMVCRDPKTNGKYEQCSYVGKPNEKAYAYSKSSSFGKPKNDKPREQPKKAPNKKPKEHQYRQEPHRHYNQEEEEEEREPEADNHHYQQEEANDSVDHHEGDQSDESSSKPAEDKEGHSSHYTPDHTYHFPSYKDFTASYEGYNNDGEEEDASPSHNVKTSANCKTVQKDGQSCTVCKDPKTGGASEKCNYAYEPKDKAYKYSKSKSFGYPESQSSNYGYSGEDDKAASGSSEATSPEKQESESGSGEDYRYTGEPSTLDYIRSESEKISKKVKGKGDCTEVKRDGMICTVCKDAKTGDDFEQCNYAYEPEDKVFAYTKSKSFGSPTKTSDDYYTGISGEEKPEESVIYPTGTSPLDYIPKASESQVRSIYSANNPQEKSPDRVDTGFYDATVRRAEIEKIVKDIGTEDKSKCKKVIRAGMTCYRCTDDKGFTSEECVFVTDDNEKTVTAATNLQVTTAATSRLSGATSTTTARPFDPVTDENSKPALVKRKTRDAQEKPKDKDEELEVLDEERDEAEPYDYVAETRPVYDKVFGVNLPAYMVERSKHEIEFDDLIEKSKS